MTDKLKVRKPENPRIEILQGQAKTAWLTSFNELSKRRVYTVLKLAQVIVGVVILSASLMLSGHGYLGFGLLVLGVSTLAYLNLAVKPYEFRELEENSEVKYTLRYTHHFANFADQAKKFLADTISSPTRFFVTLLILIAFPFAIIIYLLCIAMFAFEFISEAFWLKTFQDRKDRIGTEASMGDPTVAGTRLEEIPTPSSDEPSEAERDSAESPGDIEFAGGVLKLSPDGGLSISNGPSFDKSSTFSDLSMNGVTITRTVEDTLHVDYEGEKTTFLYKEGKWRRQS